MISIQRSCDKCVAPARRAGLNDVFIVDATLTTTKWKPLPNYWTREDPVMRQLSYSALGVARKSRGFPYSRVGYQDVGGRITREPLRQLEKTTTTAT